IVDPVMPIPTMTNLLAMAWLGLIGMALTYLLWLRGIARLDSSTVSSLLLLSPVTATLLGWLLLEQTLNTLQIVGGILVLGSIVLSQRSVSQTTDGHDAITPRNLTTAVK